MGEKKSYFMPISFILKIMAKVTDHSHISSKILPLPPLAFTLSAAKCVTYRQHENIKMLIAYNPTCVF